MTVRARVLLTALLAAPASAQLKVGDPAPAIALETWLNTEAGKPPTLESLHGRVVMIEFWGTWCGPCVRAMPEVQKMHDRHRARGLTVLAISYEAPAVLEPFLKQNAYTMPVGSDPQKKVISAYPFRGWPSTFLIDKEGKIAWIGDPYGAEAAVEKALGLESGAATLLTAWLDALKDNKDKQREALSRLQEKATPDFDLRAWALSCVPPEAVADGGSAGAPPGDGKPKPTEAAAKGPAVDGAATLRQCVAAWNGKDQNQRQDLLRRLGAGGPVAFDLAGWVKDAYAKAFPLDAKEIQALLQQQKYGPAVEALVARSPSAAVLSIAAKDKGLAEYSRKKAADARTSAKKAIMAAGWVFGTMRVRKEDNDRFWGELSVSGMQTSEDRKQITGILLDGAAVTQGGAEGFIKSRLAQALVMDDLGAGKSPRLSDLDKQVDKERQKIVKPLEDAYGPIAGKK